MINDFEVLWCALLLCYESCPTLSAWARSKRVCVCVCVCVLGGGCGRDNWLSHLGRTSKAPLGETGICPLQVGKQSRCQNPSFGNRLKVRRWVGHHSWQENQTCCCFGIGLHLWNFPKLKGCFLWINL